MAIGVIACLVALATTASAAHAAGNGMLAAVSEGKLVTVNADGSGQRTLWAPTSEITGLAWSPDGNKLALIEGGKLVVWDLASGTSRKLPEDGSRHADPTWSIDGSKIGFRRIERTSQTRTFVEPDLTNMTSAKSPDALSKAFAFSPTMDEYVYTLGSSLYSSRPELPGLGLAPAVVGTPAWNADGTALAFVSSEPIDEGPSPGLYMRSPISMNAATRFVTALPVAAPRWAPAGSLLYIADGKLSTVPATGGASTRVSGLSAVTLADWQPCDPPRTAIGCKSFAPPRCNTASVTVTTQADQPVDLPAPPCTDPAGRELSIVVVKPPERGALAGQRYTPAAGFVGQDGLLYKVSNGVGESQDVVQVKIFVVPRPAASPPGGSTPPSVTRGAPFLTARATPKLNRRRTALVRLACDQSCSFQVRLSGQLKRKPKKSFRGTLVKRSLASGKVLRVRLKLPLKPRGTLKTVWIVGTVRNAAGEVRAVKLPVKLPR